MGDVNLILGDCLQSMQDLQDDSIDLVVTDPPYGTTRNKWDSIIPLDEMWNQVKRITKPNAAIILFSAEPFTSQLVMSNPQCFRYDLIWCKPNGSDFLNANRKPIRAHENLLVFYESQPHYSRHPLRCGKPYAVTRSSKKPSNWGSFQYSWRTVNTDGERCPTTVLNFKPDRGYHPTQKPVALLEWIIESYSRPGDVVLDFTMGSGSTGVAAVKTGRRFIGIEKDPDYYAIAGERIKGAKPNG